MKERPPWARSLPKLATSMSPNQSPRPDWWSSPEVVIVHTPEGSYESAIQTCMSAKAQVSYHVLVDEVGERAVQFVPWDRKAWHALDDNSRSEGVSAAGAAAKFDVRSEQSRVLARVVAFRLHKRGLPAKWTRGKPGVRGFCRHADVQSDRSDPMSLAKWAVFVFMVKREFRRGGFRKTWGRTAA